MKNYLRLQKISEIRKTNTIPLRRNIAIAVCLIDDHCFEIHAISGKLNRSGVNLPEQPKFETFEIPPGHSREYDSERKILEHIAFGYTLSNESTGTIELLTERPMCDSCKYVLKQFNQMFPKIEVKVYEIEDL